MSQPLVVFGATGQQGGSVIDYVLNDRELSTMFRIRGITRDTNGAGAKALKAKGVEVVQAEMTEQDSLEIACQGAHTVFSNTTTVYDEKLFDREVSAGKSIADACVAAGAQYIIYSSSTPAEKFTGRAVPAFDCKVVVEDYIRTLPIKSASFAAGAFMQNYSTMQKPQPTGVPGEYSINTTIDPQKKIPLIEIVGDTGKFVGAILAEPDKYNGKNFYAASEMLSGSEIAQALSKATGKVVKYKQYPEEVFKNFFPETMAEPFCAMLAYLDNPGYYGPDTDARVERTAAQARGKLTTYAEFLEANPVKLD